MDTKCAYFLTAKISGRCLNVFILHGKTGIIDEDRGCVGAFTAMLLDGVKWVLCFKFVRYIYIQI